MVVRVYEYIGHVHQVNSLDHVALVTEKHPPGWKTLSALCGARVRLNVYESVEGAGRPCSVCFRKRKLASEWHAAGNQEATDAP